MKRRLALLAILCLVQGAQAQGGDADWSVGGHAKYRFNGYSYPDDSIFRDALGSTADDHGVEGRFTFSKRTGGWDFQADYQLIGLYADTLALADSLPGAAWGATGIIDDERRWFDLSWTLGDSSNGALLHRFDRASIGFTSENTVLRFGRQAVSWGNGMVFNPMDIFNPFDPAAVDTEYKSGDDMLYGQYLFTSGNDLQAVAVVRRDPRSGDVERDHSSLAFKYHGFVGMNEFDLLAAEHYDDRVLGVGGSVNVGGAVWRGDLTWTETEHDELFSAVTSLSYSWTWAGRNVSGLLEYYYNGFGQGGSRHSADELSANPDLLRRIERGELFTLSRHNVAASAAVEMTPLLVLTPTVLVNTADPSALLQIVAQYDWRQEARLLAALNLPVGPSGSEYGGIGSPVEGRYFSSGPSLFAQLAWYF